MGLIPRDEKFFPMFNDVARILCQCADLVAQIFAEPARLDELAVRVKDLEHQADEITHNVIVRIDRSFVTPLDAIYAKAVGELFAGTPDPLHVLKWKELFDKLEEAIDQCDDVSNVLESIALKNG